MQALRKQLSPDDAIQVEAVESRYLQGSEKMLFKSLMGLEVPADGIPLDIGVVVNNVGTLAAIGRHVDRPTDPAVGVRPKGRIMSAPTMILDLAIRHRKILAPKLCLGAHGREALLPVSHSQLMVGSTQHGKQSLQDLGAQTERVCKYSITLP